MRVPMRAFDRFSPTADRGPFRVPDYLAFTNEDERCELLFGHFYVAPSPSVAHQVVVAEMVRVLRDIAEHSGGIALPAPIDVVLAPHTVAQPDAVYVGKERMEIVGDLRIEGAPHVVVEVLSPATSRRDRIEKLRLYFESGVTEYWLVSPDTREIEFLDLTGAAPVVRLPREDVYASANLPELRIDLRAFWCEADAILSRTRGG